MPFVAQKLPLQNLTKNCENRKHGLLETISSRPVAKYKADADDPLPEALRGGARRDRGSGNASRTLDRSGARGVRDPEADGHVPLLLPMEAWSRARHGARSAPDAPRESEAREARSRSVDPRASGEGAPCRLRGEPGVARSDAVHAPHRDARGGPAGPAVERCSPRGARRADCVRGALHRER